MYLPTSAPRGAQPRPGMLVLLLVGTWGCFFDLHTLVTIILVRLQDDGRLQDDVIVSTPSEYSQHALCAQVPGNHICATFSRAVHLLLAYGLVRLWQLRSLKEEEALMDVDVLFGSLQIHFLPCMLSSSSCTPCMCTHAHNFVNLGSLAHGLPPSARSWL